MDQNLKNELVRSIFQFKRLTYTGFGMDIDKNKTNINMSEFILMNGIAENAIDSQNNVDMTDIRGYLAVSKAAISQMLGSLEKKGYINRDVDQNNRRNIIVTLTPEGREVLESQYEDFTSRLDDIMSCLGEEDVRQIITMINRLIKIINKLNDESKE